MELRGRQRRGCKEDRRAGELQNYKKNTQTRFFSFLLFFAWPAKQDGKCVLHSNFGTLRKYAGPMTGTRNCEIIQEKIQKLVFLAITFPPGNIDCSLWQGAVVIGGYLPVSQASSDRLILYNYFSKKRFIKVHIFSAESRLRRWSWTTPAGTWTQWRARTNNKGTLKRMGKCRFCSF